MLSFRYHIDPTTKQNVIAPNKTLCFSNVRGFMHKLAYFMQKNAKNTDLPASLIDKTFYFAV